MSFVQNKLKRAKLMLKLLGHHLCKNFVTDADYAKEYDTVSLTYDIWQAQMGKHTDAMITALKKYLPENSSNNFNVLDIACGTGYITNAINLINPEAKITGIDISAGMLKKCQENNKNCKNLTLLNQDALSFLKNSSQKFDLITCGWGISYFDPEILLKACANALTKNGLVAFIGNRQGTLNGLLECYLNVMTKHQDQVGKLLNISSKLAKDKNDFQSWFEKSGFVTLKACDGVEVVCKKTANELYHWIQDSGAGAGTRVMFKNEFVIKPSIISELSEKMKSQNQYCINHNFVWIVARKM